MSAVHGVAWGLIEITPENFKTFRKAVREELRTHRMVLQPTSFQRYSLIRRRNTSGKKIKQRLGGGNFVHCCTLASKIITPSNHETAP